MEMEGEKDPAMLMVVKGRRLLFCGGGSDAGMVVGINGGIVISLVVGGMTMSRLSPPLVELFDRKTPYPPSSSSFLISLRIPPKHYRFRPLLAGKRPPLQPPPAGLPLLFISPNYRETSPTTGKPLATTIQIRHH
ncbi:hypothetical protein HAX54_018536 [Datura stramonium]|uniref:AT-hook motif nuclear-localized protein n=1 Tax=Datura stramonium TaxID=4076 RepID=A0ABS8UP74_DATST|nr:hypothetical protein [Datura stramonium]